MIYVYLQIRFIWLGVTSTIVYVCAYVSLRAKIFDIVCMCTRTEFVYFLAAIGVV